MYYILEIKCGDDIITIKESMHKEEILVYLRNNHKDLQAALRVLPNAKVYLVCLGSESAAWEVEF